jgi:hypothetical protein
MNENKLLNPSFSERLFLEKKFIEWADQNGVSHEPSSFIVWYLDAIIVPGIEKEIEKVEKYAGTKDMLKIQCKALADLKKELGLE